jgi:hypothetical protein
MEWNGIDSLLGDLPPYQSMRLASGECKRWHQIPWSLRMLLLVEHPYCDIQVDNSSLAAIVTKTPANDIVSLNHILKQLVSFVSYLVS